MSITILLIAITAIISIAAFSNNAVIQKLILYPTIMSRPAEYYRLVSSGFIHADWNHLIFNMMTLYFFGAGVESIMADRFPGAGNTSYMIFYLLAVAMSSLPAMYKHKNNPHYAALGASGGVSAVLFFVIYYAPWIGINLYFIPIGIPGIIFAVLYSVYSFYMSKRGNDNIGHDAHLGGGIFGFVVALIIDPTHGLSFIYQLMHPRFNF